MKTVMLLILLTAGAARGQDLNPEFRLFRVAAAFQLCTESALKTIFTGFRNKPPPAATAAQLEGVIWNTTLDACKSHIADDRARGAVLLHYQGDSAKAKGFEDGLLWFGRAYVAGAVADSGLGTDAAGRKPAPNM